MSILNTIISPKDVRRLGVEQLNILSSEIRNLIVDTVKIRGGHLSSNLGVVELIVSLVHSFDFTSDKIVFDVGHQSYAYKILTGRREVFSSLRKKGGVSGFPDGEESEFDHFNTGHAGTALSACLGFAKARDLLKKNNYVLSFIGDGGITNGTCLEGLFSSDNKPKRFIVILNDNKMSISPQENILCKLIESNKIDLKGLGFSYVKVDNGNDIPSLLQNIERAKVESENTAVLLHVITKKGSGYKCAEERADLYHGVSANFDFTNGDMPVALGEKLLSLIEKDKKVIAVTAGMADGTGLSVIKEKFPENFFDAGIQEGFAVTYSAGLVKAGLKPIVCIYSTFMQRAYDNILHDVCLQNLPVIFCLDRAGLVGSDGKTHQGIYDISYLSHLPNLTILAPNSDLELKDALDYALSINSPVVIRYPKNSLRIDFKPIKANPWLKTVSGGRANVIAVGPRALKVATEVSKKLDGVGVISARQILPLDSKVLDDIASLPIVTIEENCFNGGFGSLVGGYLADKQIPFTLLRFGVDSSVKHATIEEQFIEQGITDTAIIKKLEKVLPKG